MQWLPRDIRPTGLLLGWLLLNLVSAAYSPLDADETYYWMYARQLAWGYFDHPPAVAVLISLGKDWLPGALGLRFGHVLASTATVVAIYHLLDRPRGRLLWLAAALVFAQPMLQVYGFIATPDGPLLLFAALYLLTYRAFLRQPSLTTGALWGIAMAGLLYSKYHGLILILVSVLPHLTWLLRQPGAWVAVLGGALLYFPHLYWQYANDYPSFRYHLGGRNDAYRFEYTLNYFLNQLLIFSPLLLYHYLNAYLYGVKRDRFDRACRWLITGFLLFFLYTTTRGGTEAQWTAVLAIPLIYLTYRAARDRFPAWRKRLFTLALLSGILLLLARLLLLIPRDWLPFPKPFDHAPWVERLAAQAEGHPVVFENSYRYASLYEFYSGGEPGWTFTDINYRRSQYDLWDGDRPLHGDTVLLVGQRDWQASDAVAFPIQRREMKIRLVTDFQVAKHVELYVSGVPDTVYSGQRLPVRVTANYSDATAYADRLDLAGDLPLDLYVALLSPDDQKYFWRLSPLQTNKLMRGEETVLFEGELTVPTEPPGETLELTIGLGYRGMPPLRGQHLPVKVQRVAPPVD